MDNAFKADPRVGHTAHQQSCSVGVGAAGRSSAAEASLCSELGAAPSLPTLSECQELENKHLSVRNGFAIILQLPASQGFDLFSIQDPKSSRSYPHALNLLS